MNMCSGSMARLAQPEQFEEHLEEQWNLDSIKAVLIRSWELNVSTKLDTSAVRPKNITKQVLDKRSYTTLHKMRLGYRSAFI